MTPAPLPLPPLTGDDFIEFFAAVNGGHKPFPWQLELARHVVDSGHWPAQLDVPTGAGKTAVIDIALFALAARLEQGDLPRRIAVVVDRRIIVAQAAARARSIASALSAQDRPEVVAVVGDRLSALCFDDPTGRARDGGAPVHVAELRGGIARDNDWVRRPDVPTVLVSTVDQVGSRLLFRGYGVSSGMSPVHTGLIGNDLLAILDEAHLSVPFLRTLRTLERLLGPGTHPSRLGRSLLPDRWEVVTMSATPGAAAARVGDDRQFVFDHAANRADPVLARRLDAAKPFTMEAVPGAKRVDLAKAVAAAVRTALSGGAKRVGVVLNRVGSSVEVAELLSSGPALDADVVVLNGRMRPWARDLVLADPTTASRLLSGSPRSDDDHPLVLVATQAVEAGADFDLDVLVTECAAWDALVQRFGRVDRLGERSAAGATTSSIVLALASDIKEGADDPVYGTALRSTWEWLHASTGGAGDMGVDRPVPTAADASNLRGAQVPAPALLLSHLDRLAQTSPMPDADVSVDAFLHGFVDVDSDISIVWRADLALLADVALLPGVEGVAAAEAMVDAVTAAPPRSGEAVAVPIGAARRWLQEVDAGDITDVVGAGELAAARFTRPSTATLRAGVLWRGDDSKVLAAAEDIRPGDVIVVGCDAGGLAFETWAPTSAGWVGEAVDPDASRAARARARRSAVLRAALPDLLGLAVEDLGEGADDLDPAVCADALLALALSRLSTTSHARHIDDLRAGGFLQSAAEARGLEAEIAPEDIDTDAATSAFAGAEVTLRRHLTSVERWARGLGSACRLPNETVDDLALAGRIHDLGKIDPRFQRWLAGDGLVGGEMLAKSKVPAGDRATRQRSRRRAGYPVGERHELFSVALVEDDVSLRDVAHDWPLVLHLVASHHGYARPFAPGAAPSAPVSARWELDGHVFEGSTDHGRAHIASGIPDRFFEVQERYGYYGLAWLETILRLADHRASEQDAAAGSVR